MFAVAGSQRELVIQTMETVAEIGIERSLSEG
jgi:hypothetical protein